MLPESGFLDTAPFMFHFKNRKQLTLATHPSAGWASTCLNPKDDDVMINDAGKQAVKTSCFPLPPGHAGGAGQAPVAALPELPR
jgi:hypothetical protein